jgi:hypothetical protein
LGETAFGHRQGLLQESVKMRDGLTKLLINLGSSLIEHTISNILVTHTHIAMST